MKLIRYIFHITGILGFLFIFLSGILLVKSIIIGFDSFEVIQGICYSVVGILLEILNSKTGERLWEK